MILQRYAEFIGATEGIEPRLLPVAGGLARASPRLGMMRLRYGFRLEDGYARLYDLGLDALPRALLVSRWRVVADPEERLAAIVDPRFDPRTLVILEAPPDPPPAAAGVPHDGRVSVVDVSSDVVVVRAELAAPALLVMTDNFSTGWRVRSLDPDPPQRYAIVPANHTLRAIPLAAGAHHLRLDYRPPAFAIGVGVTAVACLLFAAAGVWAGRRPRPPRGNATAPVARRPPDTPGARPGRRPARQFEPAERTKPGTEIASVGAPSRGIESGESTSPRATRAAGR
jgi:hypothetical protein